MRYIVIPEDVVVVDPRTKEPVGGAKSFVDYAYEVWFNDLRVSERGPVKIRRWANVVVAFDGKSAGDCVALEDEDWTTLKEIASSPKAFYPPLIASQFDSFFRAIEEAPSKAPES